MSENTLLAVPRGKANLEPLQLDMTLVYEAEGRLFEVRTVSPATAPELTGYFNEACNLSTKYLAWIEYEILQAEKGFNLAKATVILDKAPEEYKKIAGTGIKFNEDFREALIARDLECQDRLDALNGLQAIKALIESKSKSFERAYYACRHIAESKQKTAAMPNFSGTIGQTYEDEQNNFMGQRKRS